jgi:glycine hydroxymethyltransferase
LRGPRGAMILCRRQYAEAIDKAVFPGLQGGPHDNQTAAIAVALKEAATPEFAAYSARVVSNAGVLADEMLRLGYNLVTGGTDNHLLLVDLTNKGVTGKAAQEALDSAGITLNRNAVPYDPRPPYSPSGIRLGTPAVTSRGMGKSEMRLIARWLDAVIVAKGDVAVAARVRSEIRQMVEAFPVPGIDHAAMEEDAEGVTA